MTKVWRWLSNFALGASLLLVVLIPVLWVQSYYGGIDAGGWQPHLFVIRFPDATTFPPSKRLAMVPRIKAFGTLWKAYSWRGGFSLCWLDANYMQHSSGSIYERADPVFLGFGLNRAPAGTIFPGNQVTIARQGTLRIPFWFFQFLTLIIPAYWLVSWRRRTRVAFRLKHDLCPACGYDLRATPDQCPECGWKPTKLDCLPLIKSLVRTCVNRCPRQLRWNRGQQQPHPPPA